MRLFAGLDRVLGPLSWVVALGVAVLLFAGPALIGAKEEGRAAKDAAAAKAKQQAKEAEEPEFPTEDAQDVPGGEEAPAEETPAEEAPAEEAPAVDGAAVFASAGCGSCHTFKAAGSTGTTGPDLDAAAPDAAAAEAKIRSGGGIMPAFEGQLSDAEIAAVAAFVSGG